MPCEHIQTHRACVRVSYIEENGVGRMLRNAKVVAMIQGGRLLQNTSGVAPLIREKNGGRVQRPLADKSQENAGSPVSEC